MSATTTSPRAGPRLPPPLRGPADNRRTIPYGDAATAAPARPRASRSPAFPSRNQRLDVRAARLLGVGDAPARRAARPGLLRRQRRRPPPCQPPWGAARGAGAGAGAGAARRGELVEAGGVPR